MKFALSIVLTLAALYDTAPSATGSLILVDIVEGRRNFWPQYSSIPSEPRYNDIPSGPFSSQYRSQEPAITTSNMRSATPPPPPIDDIARYARYIVHYTDWTSLGHISHQDKTSWFPSARVFSMADGPLNTSTGIPYIYTSFHDGVPRDLKIDPRCSMTMSLAQTDFCKNKGLDPEDPRCSQVILTGYFVILQNNTDEWKFAENALFSRHPEMKSWPESHHFFFGKLQIFSIQLVDNIGGSKYPNVVDYYNAQPPMVQEETPWVQISENESEERSPFEEIFDVNMVR